MESNKIKKSKISWFGNVPIDWEEYQIKHLFDIGRGRVISILDMKDEGKYPVFSSQTLNNGIMGYVDTYDFDGEYLTWTTDGVYAGTIFKRKGKFNCTNICGTLKAKDKRKINIDFAKYSLEYVTEYCKRPDTNGAKIMNNEMAAIKIYLPNLNEQYKIADFLDFKCQKIDDTIEKINKQIEVLKKYKQSLITEVVTKGLDKNVEMKDSGVEWIGKMPKGWEVKRLKYTCKQRSEKNSLEKELDYFALENIESWNFRYIETENEYDISESNICKKDDVVFGKLRPYLAKTFLVDYDRCCSSEFVVFYDFCDLQKFLLYILTSYGFVTIVDSSTYGTKMPRASVEFIKNMRIPLPELNEQEKIVSYLDKKCAKIDAIIDKKSKQIEILERYKKSLIYEYVTGKKRVK